MRIVCAVLACAASIAAQAPKPISVLASGAAEGSLVALAATLPAATVQFETSQGISDRLRDGDTPDVLVAQAAMIEQLIKDGKALAATRIALGRMPIGVAINPSGTRPDVGSVESLKAAILRADAVVISQGASGTLLERTFREIGVADQIRSKLRREPRGNEVMQEVGKSGGTVIGFTMVSEIKHGERYGGRYVGPLPAAIQHSTPYDAVVLAATKLPDAARAFVRTLATPPARRVLAANGWEF